MVKILLKTIPNQVHVTPEFKIGLHQVVSLIYTIQLSRNLKSNINEYISFLRISTLITIIILSASMRMLVTSIQLSLPSWTASSCTCP